MNLSKKADNMIRLEKFTPENADMILSWRNSKRVRENSLDDKEISLKDHLKFIETLEQKQRYFFILYFNGNPQGVFNVNKNKETGLWGCYLAETKVVRPSIFPLMIALSGRLAFEELHLDSLDSEVLEHNQAPQKVNSFLGVTQAGTRIESRQNGEQLSILCYRLHRSDWNNVYEKVFQLLPSEMKQNLKSFSYHHL
jgi:RimJ/RimL family protein N-acetyltransferase